MKKLLKILILLILLIVAAVGYAVYRVDDIAKAAVEEGGTYALGVPTTLAGIHIGLMSGSCELRSLEIANPAGAYQGKFFQLGRGAVSVSLPSLRQDVVEVPSLQISDVLVSLERIEGDSNYQTILDNIKKTTGSGSSGASTGGGESSGELEKRFIVREVKIENVKIDAQLLPKMGDLTRVSLTVPTIELENIGNAEGSTERGVVLSELVSILVRAILDAAVKSGKLPTEMLGDLQGRLAALGDLKGIGLEKVEQLKSDVEAAKQKVVEQAGEAGKLLEGAKGLLGGEEEKK